MVAAGLEGGRWHGETTSRGRIGLEGCEVSKKKKKKKKKRGGGT
jgi:hypothetical protein